MTLAEMRRLWVLAKAATPGPWKYEDSQLKVTDPDLVFGLDVLSCCNMDNDTMEYVAAANPSAVVALLTYAREQAIAAGNWPCECGHQWQQGGMGARVHCRECQCPGYQPAALDVPEEAKRE